MDVATLMFIAYRAMDDRVIRAMREAGYNVTVAQARLAQRVAEDGSRLTDLAEQVQVTKQTASLLVAALEREGLVERIPDPQDGRAQLIRFTRKGQAASARARTVVMASSRNGTTTSAPNWQDAFERRSQNSAKSPIRTGDSG